MKLVVLVALVAALASATLVRDVKYRPMPLMQKIDPSLPVAADGTQPHAHAIDYRPMPELRKAGDEPRLVYAPQPALQKIDGNKYKPAPMLQKINPDLPVRADGTQAQPAQPAHADRFVGGVFRRDGEQQLVSEPSGVTRPHGNDPQQQRGTRYNPLPMMTPMNPHSRHSPDSQHVHISYSPMPALTHVASTHVRPGNAPVNPIMYAPMPQLSNTDGTRTRFYKR